jgi:hypothetical protein
MKLLWSLCFLVMTHTATAAEQNRIGVDTDWFWLSEDQVGFSMTYNGWDLREHKRIRHRGISAAAKEIIEHAQKQITISVFLFDNMYSPNKPEYDVVAEMTALLVQKKHDYPNIKIVLILDALNRLYARRVAPSVKTLIDNGVDVFYSDTLPTKAATKDGILEAIAEISRKLDKLTRGLTGSVFSEVTSRINLPKQMDGQSVDLEVALGASILKANHRKIIVADIDGTNQLQALVPSANPHNASDDATNSALLVKGDLAKYIYGVLRADAAHSLNMQVERPLNVGPDKFALLSEQSKKTYGLKDSKRYLTEALPPVIFADLNHGDSKSNSPKAKFLTEGKIKKEVIRLLDEAKPTDDIRIQMFYLSQPEVVQAIVKAANQAGRSSPVRLLLDPNKDAFNSIKDGTPNRQVAHYLLQSIEAGKVEVRWYATHGEQNHAKIMSITGQDKFEIISGSCNWTGKNMNDVNMEANLLISGAETQVEQFNQIFDRLWGNVEKDVLYSFPYEAYDLKNTRYLVVGYAAYKKMTTSQRTDWVSKNHDRLVEAYIKDHPMIDADQKAWAENAIAKDQSGLMRITTLLLGQDAISKDDTNDKKLKWEAGYLKKWVDGEKGGYVAW